MGSGGNGEEDGENGDDGENETNSDQEPESGQEDETGDVSEEGEEHTVTVGSGGSMTFEPDSLEIEPGDTVEFVWDSSGHTVTVLSQPDEGNWEGAEEIHDEGYTHSHTFEAEGEYSYECTEHAAMGMTGEILVESGEQ